MIKASGNKLQISISYAVYILSGFLIFSPLHKSENLPISLLCSIASSSVLLLIIFALLSQKKKASKHKAAFSRITSAIATIASLFASLMLLTEIIKDVAYIANRGVSLPYYTFTALIILCVSFYLCTSSARGVYRFTILSSLVFFILFSVMFFSLFTTKGITVSFSSEKSSLIPAVLTGIRSGIFLTVDSSVFFICFREQIKNADGMIPKKELVLGFTAAYTFIIIYNLLTVLIFGQLTSKISDPDYALIKLVSGIDLTEIVSAIRIVSFLIKSCIYIRLSAKHLKNEFSKDKTKEKTLIGLLYLTIPLTFLFLAFFDTSLKYGAFQHLIYPTIAIVSFCFMYLYRA